MQTRAFLRGEGFIAHVSLHAGAPRHWLWVLCDKHTEKYTCSMKGKNFKKGKVSSHLEQSPPCSHVAHMTTHTRAHRTDSPHTRTLTVHAPVQHSRPDARAHTHTHRRPTRWHTPHTCTRTRTKVQAQQRKWKKSVTHEEPPFHPLVHISY